MDANLARKIFNEIGSCRCEYKYGPSPFYFSMSDYKKVMLITLVPSFQAVYRPLASTRFFRVLCLALFGANPMVGSLTESFLYGEIYWTHCHKCYFPRSPNYPNDVPEHCTEKYINREISILSPKLIIVLGDVVARRLLGEVPQPGKILHKQLFNIPIICANFPQHGCEPEFAEIREALSRVICGVDVSKVADIMKSKSLNAIGTIAKHAEFEFRGLESYWSSLKKSYQHANKSQLMDGDEMWYQTELIPRWSRYSFIALCFSFIEDQLNPLLLEVGITCDIIKKTPIEDLLKTIVDQYGKDRIRQLDPTLRRDILSLKKVRKYVVHTGGRVPLGVNFDNIEGIYVQLGMLEITDVGCEWALNIVRRVVNTLIKFEVKTR
jgi:hypothetical protein